MRSASAQILGGTVDAIHVSVTGLTGAGNIEAAASAILQSMVVNGTRIAPGGASSPFCSAMTGEAFRAINNLEEGYLNAADGFFIQTGRQIYAQDEGLMIRLNWDQPAIADVDMSAAVVTIRRFALILAAPTQPLRLYDAQPVTATQERFTATLPNCSRVIYVGNALMKADLNVNGATYANDASFLVALSRSAYSHEQVTAPSAIVLFDSDLSYPVSPVVTIHAAAASGTVVQVGQA
jgi:hypothetical protein